MPALQNLLRLAVAATGCLCIASQAVAAGDPFTSQAQPANALIVPFDAVDRSTMIVVSNLTGKTEVEGGGFLLGVTTHWVFWDRRGGHLADVWICLTLNDTIVVDPTNLSDIDVANHPIRPVIDLSGQRGFAVITAYQTDEICTDGATVGATLVNDAITGGFSITSANGTELSGNALGLATDASGSFTNLPDFRLSTGGVGSLDLMALDPSVLESSLVVLVALKERKGALSGEVGPLPKRVTAPLVFYDDWEVPTSLPDVTFRGARFTSFMPGPGGLAPDTITFGSPGIFRLTDVRAGNTPVGCNSFVYAFGASTVGNLTTSLSGQYSADGAGCG